MMIPHEPWLVILSIAIAIQGSFVGLSLARGLDSAEGFRRRLALAGSAITLATGVWSMHFVAMLAANFPSAVDYLVLPTLISFLICVIVVGIGVYAAHVRPNWPTVFCLTRANRARAADHQKQARAICIGRMS
jgi:diguanylate cyclase